MTMSVAITARDTNWMGGVAHKMRVRAAGGGHSYMRDKLRERGEVLMASPTRLGREAWARGQWTYRLRHPDGAYVNADLSGETDDVHQAWKGFAHQLDTVRDRRPDLADYRTVELPPEGKRGIGGQ